MTKKMTMPQLHGAGFALIAVLLLLLWGFGVRNYTNKKVELDKDTDVKQKAGGTPEMVKQKEKELVSEKKKADEANQDWKVYSSKYMPDIDFSEKTGLINQYQTNFVKVDGKTWGLKEMPTVWGRWLESWYDVQHNSGVDRGIPYFAIASYSVDPNKISEMKNITFPDKQPWKVTVNAKDFDSAMAHLRRFNTMEHHGMPVISGVALSGHSPNLTLAYNLSLYIIPGSEPPKEDPRIGGAAKTGGGGGGMAGMTGMMGGGGMSGMSGGPSGGMSGGPSGGSGGGGAASKGAAAE